ncbi:ABC transporter permease [Brevibacillus nitrificans]|uniref:ABC transporter permease n=1 Tax=Brevibacillus nitrificans TaxID=651560 RepID=UPI00285DA6A6|nr:ABC transporter permease [Brevibacillus nitrificans]MDR7316843.1 peptide/nickel transport system permease protein [Brevibacillus nitrificans]
MLKLILKRLVDLIPTLLVVATTVFIITRLIPGDPAAVLLGPQASPDEIAKMRETLGLNEPMYLQYFDFLGSLLQGDLGTSLGYHQPVLSLILERFPNTLLLSVCALAIALLIGIPAGIISATKQYSVWDYTVMILSLVGVSMPIFWLGVMLVLYFSVHLGWLPATGMGSMTEGLGSVVTHLVLPSIALSTIPMATFARITRSSMLEVIKQDYIKTARAKGLREFFVVWKHALKNAMTPLLTVMGMQISSMLGGAVLTETIFSWPGMGRLVVDAIENRDFVVVQGTVLFIAVIFVLINLLVDILYTVVNPRVNLSKKGEG